MSVSASLLSCTFVDTAVSDGRGERAEKHTAVLRQLTLNTDRATVMN